MKENNLETQKQVNEQIRGHLSLSGSVALDTGLLLEFFTNGPLAGLVTDEIFNNSEVKTIYIHDYNITELFAAICKQKGVSFAEETVEELMKFTKVVSTSKLRYIAGEFKAKRNLSMSDCFSLSISKRYKIPVLFKKKQELELEMKKRPFEMYNKIDVFSIDPELITSQKTDDESSSEKTM